MQSSSSQSSAVATRLNLVALLGIVLAARLVFVFAISPNDGTRKFGPDAWLATAAHVAQGHGYSFPDETTPTARRGPTVVFYFATILFLFGESEIAIIIGQWIMDLLSAYLLFRISQEIFPDDRWTSTLAVLLFAIYPPSLYLSARAWSEPITTACLLGFSLVFLRTIKHPSLPRCASAGFLLGLAAMARSIILYFPLVVLPLLFLLRKDTARRALTSGAILTAAFALTLSPWIARNALVFGAFIPGSTIKGIPAFQSHFALESDDYARYRSAAESNRMLRSILEERFGKEPSNTSYFDYLKAHRLTEVDVDKVAQREAFRKIREHPGRYLYLCALRVARILLHVGYAGGNPAPSPIIAGVNGTLLLLAILSLFHSRGGWRRRALPLIVFFLFHTFALAAVFGLGRYCAPVAPFLLLFAAHALVGIVAFGAGKK